MLKKITFLVLFLTLFLAISFKIVWADLTPTPTSAPSSTSAPDPSSISTSVPECTQNKISIADCPAYIQKKLDQLKGQENSVTSQIAVMDNQVKLTEARIENTKTELLSLSADIDTAGKKIVTLEKDLSGLTGILINRIVATYKVGSAPDFEVLLASDNVSNFFTKLNYLRIAQAHDKQLIYDTQQAKTDYSNQKGIFEDKKKKVEALKAQLEDYTAQLNQQKQAQQVLLAQVQKNKAVTQVEYQRALAELAGFSRFVTSQGGASILTGQTSCDGWGCYYNQRDSQWGNLLINGQNGYSVAGYGCLITSIAMIASHMGHRDILPSDIALSSGDNFAAGTAMLRFTISVKGLTISRSGTSLDSSLQDGPVIVGIYAYGGTHFVVIKSGSGGNYIMDDPYVAGGHDIPFTDHYSTGSIFEVDKISM